jgi:DNA-binding MarR family transcriptional regulator
MARAQTFPIDSSLVQQTLVRLLAAAADDWAKTDLTMPQLKVLLLLAERGSARVSWLAAHMQVSPPNITGILDRLEEHGRVARTNEPQDRRVVRIVLTETGHSLLRDLCRAGADRLVATLEALPRQHRDSANRELAELISSLLTTGRTSSDGTDDGGDESVTNGHQPHSSRTRA